MSYRAEEKEKDSLDSDSLESGEGEFESIGASDISEDKFYKSLKKPKYTKEIEKMPKMKQTRSYKDAPLENKRKKKQKKGSREKLSDNEDLNISEEDFKEESKSTQSKRKSNPSKRSKHDKAKRRKTRAKQMVEEEKQPELDTISEKKNKDLYKANIKTSMDKIKDLLKSQSKLPESKSSLNVIKTTMNYLLKSSREITSQLSKNDFSSLNQEANSNQVSIKVAQIKDFVQKWEKENNTFDIQDEMQEPEKENRFEQIKILIERLKWSTLMHFKALSSEKKIDVSSVNETLETNSETFKLILTNLNSIYEKIEPSTQQASQESIDLQSKLKEIIDAVNVSKKSTESCYHKSAGLISEIYDISEVDSESDLDDSDEEEIQESSQS